MSEESEESEESVADFCRDNDNVAFVCDHMCDLQLACFFVSGSVAQ